MIKEPFIFISYSKNDTLWKNLVLKHLIGYAFQGMCQIWHDRDVEDGDKWFREIFTAIKQADIVICLLSPDYITSEFCLIEELPYILKRKDEDGIKTFFIHVEPCDISSIEWLDARQIFPDDEMAFGHPDCGEGWKLHLVELSKRIGNFLRQRVPSPKGPEISKNVQMFIKETEIL